MKAVARLLLACTLSVTVAAVLAYMQHTSPSGPGDGGLPAFSHKAKPLTDANIVDKLSPLALHLSIAKVDWREPTLAVDLWIKPVDANRDQVFDDLLRLTQLSFSGTSNVDHLLVRVMDDGREGKKLLLTMDARRGHFTARDYKNDALSSQEARALLQSNTALTYTALWRNRFGS